MMRASWMSALAGYSVHAARVRTQQTSIAGVEIRNYQADADEWIVKFRAGTSNEEIEKFCSGNCQFMGHPNEGSVAWATVKGTRTVEGLLHQRTSHVEYLQPDVEDSMIPVIEERPSEIGIQAPSNWGLKEINAEYRSNIGAGVHVYVQDTGVRTTHFLFGGRARSELDLTSGSPVECNGDRSCARDRTGHGTHCAGVAAGSTYGVAPGASIHAIKTLGDSGSGQRSWNYVGLEHVTLKGKRPAVLSMSLGGMGQDQTYSDLITTATDSGVVVVVASGNYGINACEVSPAFAPDAITVGASTSYDSRAGYSNYGECLDIYAPGSHILSAYHESDTSTYSMTGTSMACPHVSGAAALFFGENPGLSARDVWASMKRQAIWGKMSGLKENDPDLFLNVPGAPAPGPAPPPTPAPPMAPCEAQGGSGPDSDNDCKCPSGKTCYHNGSLGGCPFSRTPSSGATSGRYFSPDCDVCMCKSR